MTIQEIMDRVAEQWKFQNENYPELEDKTSNEQKIFALRHILFHQMKAMGPLIEFLEQYDHNRLIFSIETPDIVLLEATRKMVLNGLRLAELLGEYSENLEFWLVNQSTPS